MVQRYSRAADFIYERLATLEFKVAKPSRMVK
jgi:hypothetical protein